MRRGRKPRFPGQDLVSMHLQLPEDTRQRMKILAAKNNQSAAEYIANLIDGEWNSDQFKEIQK